MADIAWKVSSGNVGCVSLPALHHRKAHADGLPARKQMAKRQLVDLKSIFRIISLLVRKRPISQCPSDWGPQAPWPGGRGPLGFTPRFDAGAPARGPRKDFARGPFVGLYSHPTCQGRVHVPVSYPGCFTHLKKIILYKA